MDPVTTALLESRPLQERYQVRLDHRPITPRQLLASAEADGRHFSRRYRTFAVRLCRYLTARGVGTRYLSQMFAVWCACRDDCPHFAIFNKNAEKWWGHDVKPEATP